MQYNKTEIAGIRYASLRAKQCLKYAESLVKEGVTPLEIDIAVEAFIRSLNGKSEMIGYQGYQHATCISVNFVAYNGVPDNVPLRLGDIVTVDLAANWGGFAGDVADTFIVGKEQLPSEILEVSRKLVDEAHIALAIAVGAVKEGGRYGDISKELGKYFDGCSHVQLVYSCTGHGIGIRMHEKPHISLSPRLTSGFEDTKIMIGDVFCIEPVVTYGSGNVTTRRDGWSALSDGLCAMVEEVVAVTEDGVEILSG